MGAIDSGMEITGTRAVAALAEARQPRRSELRRFTASLLQSKTGLVGLVIVVLTALGALAAPAIAPKDPATQDLRARLTPPAWQSGNTEHLLGTDALGRDILSRVIYGARISLIVGVAAVLIAGILGTVTGLISGYYGRAIDGVFMRLADVQLALPSLVLYLTIMAVLGPSLRNLILGLGITNWVVFARVTRSEVLTLRHAQFVEAARATGMGNLRIILVQILPNTANTAIVLSTIIVAGLILAEAGLSFLGLGVPPPTPTWGGMVADGRDYIELAWWISTVPGVAILITVLGFNLFGDWLRDYLDPRLRRS